METRKANLFVVGAMKAGTTSFMNLLSGHPQIYVPPIKEPHYHIHTLPRSLYEPSRFFDETQYFAKEFPESRHIANLKSLKHYEKLFSLGGEEKYYVDGSTVYLAAPESAELIKSYNKEAKIIVLLRDPIQRMYSHYLMDKGLSRENRTFDEVVSSEVKLYHKKQLPHFSYIGLSLYEVQIDRFRNCFNDVLILNFESLISNQNKTLAEVTAFLQIEPFFSDTLDHANRTRKLKYSKFFYFLKKLGLKDYFSKILSVKLRRKLFNLVSTSRKDTLILSEENKKELKVIFEQEILL